MTVRVRLFALARQLAGCRCVEVELPEGATVGQLRKRLAVEVPALANTIDRMMFALGVDYAGDGDPVTADVEVACFPPVSGG